jgi:BON domain
MTMANQPDEQADQTEQHGGGQSGYGAGRDHDRAMGPGFRNQTDPGRETDNDGGAVRTDDRFQGRGGESTERADYNSGYNQGGMGFGGNPEQAPAPATPDPANFMRSDDRIREAITEALAGDNHVDATHIEVVVKNGEVMLTGSVDDLQQKRMAGDLALNQASVQDVQNQLRVGGNPPGESAVGKSETVSTDKPRA